MLCGPAHVKLAPSNQFPEDRRKITSSRRRVILLARRMVGVLPAVHHPAALEPSQSIRQDVARNPLRGRQEFRKAMLVVQKQVANDEQRPAVTNQIKSAGDRTWRTPRTAGVRVSLRFGGHTSQYTQRLAFYKRLA